MVTERRLILIASIIILIIAISSLFYNILGPTGLEMMRRLGLNAKDESPNYLWWLKGQKMDGYPHPKYESLITKIDNLRTIPGSHLNKIYGNLFVNPWNSTVWLVITDISPPSIQSIEESLGRHDGATLLYLKAPAIESDLIRYQSIMYEKRMLFDKIGVKILSTGISENATLIIGLESVTPYNVCALIFCIPEIPRSVLVIRRGSQVVPVMYSERKLGQLLA
jgi:hypothetical protein